MIRIGVVGAGGMAGERCRVFKGMKAARVEAVCARSREKAESLAKRAGAKAFDDFERMLSGVDAVVLCLPNVAHAEFARKALQARKHVLVEYPLCVSMAEAKVLRARARKSGRVLMTGNTIIHEAMFAYLRERRERLGEILSAASRVAFYGKRIAGRWYMTEASTGPVFASFHYHHIEYYRNFLGEVEWVLARNESRPDAARPGYSSAAGGTLVMGHASGATSCVQWYLNADGNGLPRGLWMNGTRASVTIISREPERSLAVWDNGGEGKEDVFDDEWGVPGSCRDFIEAIEGRLDHRARLDWDIKTLRVGVLAAESARTGEVVRIKP